MAGPRRWPRRWGGLSSERCAVGWMSSYVERVPAAHMPLKPRLSRLDIELTERCNNDCIHCCINLPASDRHARSREMTTARVCDVIGEAAELGCLQVRLTGGEPLLRPDFEEIYLFARKLGLKVLIFTNARLISRHLADLLRDVPPLADIEVTVYGMHARSYDAVTRVPGSFAQFRRGVRRLLERRIRLVVKGALLPPNRGELAKSSTSGRRAYSECGKHPATPCSTTCATGATIQRRTFSSSRSACRPRRLGTYWLAME